MNETIKIWLEKLGTPTKEKVLEEIEEVKGTIENERIWAKAENIHYENIKVLTEYLEKLNEILENLKHTA